MAVRVCVHGIECVCVCVFGGVCVGRGWGKWVQPFMLPGVIGQPPGSLARALPWPLRAFVGDSHDGFHVYPRDRNALPGVA